MKRILIIGTSGAGKSTLAQRLSNYLRVPFFPSDQFYWDPGWKIASPERVREQVTNVIHQETWVLDGNFDDEREMVWKRTDCIIWLDFSLLTICRRIAFRNLLWLITRQPTWSGNRMTLPRAISGIRHAVKSYPLKRRNYPQWLAELSGVAIYHFYTSHEMDAWLQSLKPRSRQYG
jgi:GTPase SAR1 family protein